MLIDSYNSKNKNGNLAKVKAIVGYVDDMKKAKVPEREALKHLTEEEKEDYEFGKFHQAQEKRYGRKTELIDKQKADRQGAT